MAGNQLSGRSAKTFADPEKQFSRNILRSRSDLSEDRIVSIQKLVIELGMKNFAGAFLELTYVHEHSVHGIDGSREGEISDVISANPKSSRSLRPESFQVLSLAPAGDE